MAADPRRKTSLCSERGRHAAEDTLADIHILLLQYMRALLFLCCATFISFSIVLSAMRVRSPSCLASVAFLLEFIPLVATSGSDR